MCLHRCRLLSGFSDSQSWAQQSEIKKQNQKKLGRGQSESRVLREAAETRGLGGSSVEGLQTGGGMLSPRARGSSVPTRILPICAESQGAAQHCPMEARMADDHPASDLTGESPRQMYTRAHPQSWHRPLAATKFLDHRGCRASAQPGI